MSPHFVSRSMFLRKFKELLRTIIVLGIKSLKFKHISNILYHKAMSHQKTKIQQEEKMLEEFLRLKPTRAIDRLLNQYNIEKVYSIYNTLQEKIRRNTSDLRATLTDKYENLVDCSNLLTTIQTFTNEIEAIAKDIDKTFQKNKSQPMQIQKARVSHIAIIEEQIHRKKYLLAMKQSHKTNIQGLRENQLQYLPFLRIQILQALEKQLINKKITQTFIKEVVSCLQIFIKGLLERDYTQISQTVYQEGTLLALISDYLKRKCEQEVDQSQILQILFKCKLFSLNRTVRQAQQYDKISKFFHDILQLLSEENRQKDGTGQLTAIFCANLNQIQSHLSQTFIRSSGNQIIQFRYDLYEQLLSSEQFVLVLRQLHEIISKDQVAAPALSLHQSFLNLWNNYQRQLLSLLFNKCNPVGRVSIQTQKGQREIPRQLSKYISTHEVSVENMLKEFRGELELFYKNILQLVSKAYELKNKAISQETSLEKITTQYQQNMQKMNKDICCKLQELAQNPCQANLRSTILLFLLCNEFNIYIQQNFSKHEILAVMTSFKLKWNQNLVRKYSSVFGNGKAKNWTINFDHFFMHYAGLINSSKIQLVRKAVVSVVEGMMLERSPVQAEKCFEEWNKKKVKEQKLLLDQKGKLKDLVVSEVGAITFAKKKLKSSQG